MDKYINVKDINFQWLPLSVLTDEFVTKTQINSIPAADVEPVIHAHWIKYRTEPSQPEHIKCSNCGQYWAISDHANIFKRCFNCGAKMVEEVK